MIASTSVTFADGEVRGSSRIALVARHGDEFAIVADETPFHPVDHTWPDQPGDRGTITADGTHHVVHDTVMAAVSPDGELQVGEDIEVKRGDPTFTWLVAHLSATHPDEGAAAELVVDEQRRAELSRGHTACHLASLALNRAVAELWRKDARVDSLGAPDFDGAANQESRIVANGAIDEYRLGKSVRKMGVDTATLLDTLDAVAARVNEQLDAWVRSAAPVRVDASGPEITDLRIWECELPEGTSRIPCGGTHVSSLGAFSSVTVAFESDDASHLRMTTIGVPALHAAVAA